MKHTSTKFQVVFASSVALGALLPLSSAYAAMPLAAHRAVYEVTLKDASDRSGITGMDGRIVYEFRGSPCAGYTTNLRFVTRLNANGDSNITDQRSSTFESAKGDYFRFATSIYVGDKKDREIEGAAKLVDGKLEVELKQPDENELALGKAFFPTSHMLDMLEHAEAGDTLYEAPIFDGSDNADKVMTTTVIIGAKKPKEGNDAKFVEQFENNSYRKVSVTYFNESKEDDNAEALPEYAISYKLYDNGVTSDLIMDYGDFILSGKMTGLEMLKSDPCN